MVGEPSVGQVSVLYVIRILKGNFNFGYKRLKTWGRNQKQSVMRQQHLKVEKTSIKFMITFNVMVVKPKFYSCKIRLTSANFKPCVKTAFSQQQTQLCYNKFKVFLNLFGVKITVFHVVVSCDVSFYVILFLCGNRHTKLTQLTQEQLNSRILEFKPMLSDPKCKKTGKIKFSIVSFGKTEFIVLNINQCRIKWL